MEDQHTSKKETGLLDSEGIMIFEGDRVSLAGNMTADDSMGLLPNGWIFDEEDIYEVYYEPSIKTWSLKLGVQPDSAENRKYYNHALSLLHGKAVKVIK